MAAARRVRFGPFELDERTGELLKSGRRVRVRDQPIQILQALLERPGEVVTREALRARLWPADTFVDFEHGVNSAVRRLRDALGDSADRPKFVETLPRLGYRFIGTIEVDEAAAPALAGVQTAATSAIAATANEAPLPADVAAPIRRAWPRRWLIGVAALVAIASSAIVFSRRGDGRPVSSGAEWSEPARLTFEDGLQTNPSFSRDGRSIAYSDNAAGNFDIWTQRVDEDGTAIGNPVRVTTHAADDWQPDWSPDGERIAFRSERGQGGIFITPATGGAEVTLAGFGYRPQWSPDGKFIVFTNSLIAGLSTAIFVVNADERVPRPLPTPGVSGGGLGWRPDSHEIVVLNAFRIPLGIRLVTVNVDTRQPVEWTFEDAVIDAFREQALSVPSERLTWSGDGKAIYFIGTGRGLRSVWRIDLDAAARRVIGGPTRITGTSREANNFALSRDGRRIAFDGSTRAARLWAYELDATGCVRPGFEQPVSLEALHTSSPDLSPDGRMLISMQSQPGSRQRLQIVVRDMMTGRDRTLWTVDDDRQNVSFLRWNTSGTRLSRLDTFRDGVNASTSEVRLFDLATGRDDALTSRAATGSVAGLPSDWTSDDTAIVTTSTEGRTAIRLLPAAGAPRAETSAIIVTSPRAGDMYQASASPDGRWITFRAARVPGLPGSRVAIVSTSARGTDETSWIVAAGSETWSVDKPRWGAGSDRIYFTGTHGDPLSVWSIGFDSVRGAVVGEPRPELVFDSPAAHLLPDVREFELAVGAGRLVVPIVRPKGGLWITARKP